MTNTLYNALVAPHENSDGDFLRYADGGTLSYRAFVALSGRYANTLCAHGLKPGDRLALQVEKSPEALAIYAACLRAGIIFLPLNTAYTPREMTYFVEDATPGLVICDPRAADELRNVATAVLTLDANGAGSFADAAAGAEAEFIPVPRAADDLAAFLYTSGTTGRSKGAMLSHGNLLSNAEALTRTWRFTAAVAAAVMGYSSRCGLWHTAGRSRCVCEPSKAKRVRPARTLARVIRQLRVVAKG